MKRSYFAILLLLITGFFTSCERDIHTDIVSATAPALQVNVKNAAGTAFQGATVSLYADEATWTAEGTPAASGQTDGNGSIVFTQAQLKNPGNFYLIATQGSLKAKAKTPYLLLTDGKTNFNLSLK